MRNGVFAGLAASAISIALVTPSAALPPVGFNVAPQESVPSNVEQSRLFCYNRFSGRFLHWGPCGGYRRVWYRPRIYCRNRYTGRFLHWGSCW